MDSPLRYELIKNDPRTRARLGRVTTRHGSFDTPAFMPVGTQGAVKGLFPNQLAESGAQCILGNTYHLMLRPGEKTVAALGDLHKFMAWPGPILTDSGGFQVFSLADINRINDDGVTFKSHIDGRMFELTPQRSMAVQNDLGADIIMAFDECPDPNKPIEYQKLAVERTLRWAEVCLDSHARKDDQSLFGIVQGGTNAELRLACAQKLVGMNFSGYAVGGLAVGEGFDAMVKVLDYTVHALPETKPRYLMGVGFARDIIAAVRAGIDMFDCVMPTRNGRNGYAFTSAGPIRITNSKYIRDPGPIEPGCDCYACRTYPRGSIRHFFFASEMAGPILLSLHNMRFFQRLMADIRGAIGEGRFDDFAKNDPRSQMGAAGLSPQVNAVEASETDSGKTSGLKPAAEAIESTEKGL